MKKKYLATLCAVFLILAAIATISILNIKANEVDVSSINDALKTAEGNINGNLTQAFRNKNYNFSFAVLDEGGNVLYKSGKDAKVKPYDAIRSGGSAISIKGGTFLVTSNISESSARVQKTALIFALSFLIAGFLVSMFFYLYIDKRFLRPFEKMSGLAQNIAEGNFDVPLNMDKGNIFGAFTESFDLLRSQLQISRENERRAAESKKQLVASLSHDIRTPLASIKAIAELLSVKTEDENIKNKLDTINKKAEQISLLTDNLFHATLEELHELKVEPKDEESLILKEIIREADYKNLVCDFEIAGAIIVLDKLRAQQVFDNIIGNSYKYADTKIKVVSEIEGEFLKVTLKDSGGGVPEGELSLITQKYYRGKNAQGKDGSGIGLYMCSYFLEKMGGHFEVCNKDGGFCNVLYFKLS